MNPQDPTLSAVILVGSNRHDAQDVLNALARQTLPMEQLEVVLFDMGDAGQSPLAPPANLKVRYIRQPGTQYWRVARAAAARQATGRIIAFLEDHCLPFPEWGEELVDFYDKGHWAAVGYAFTNGSADSWWSRASLMADYGPFAHPVSGGPARLLPGSNVSYTRAVLDRLGAAFETAVGVDYNLHERISAMGLPMAIAPRARVAHRCYANLARLCAANFSYVRMLAVARSRDHHWSFRQRLARAVAGPLLVPPLRLARLAGCCRHRPGLLRAYLSSLPVVAITYTAAALGESWGYLFGLGDAEEQFVRWELNTSRIR